MNRSVGFISKQTPLFWRVCHIYFPSQSFSTVSSSVENDYHPYHVKVTRNVQYSDCHERNVMDIYQPVVEISNDNDSFLFVHGGMWLRGSKDQQNLSYTDISYELAAELYQSIWTYTTGHPSSNDQNMMNKNSHYCSNNNFGLIMASSVYGGKRNVYIPNYRLVGRASDDTVYPQQVYDVARSIKYALVREWRKSENPKKLWIGGHSAGAHLAALVLSDDQFMNHVLKEKYPQEEECEVTLNWRDMIAGFIGISGPYNLQRLAMSSMADITIGPTFLGKGIHDGRIKSYTNNVDESQLIKEASPIHVLLDKKKKNQQKLTIDDNHCKGTAKSLPLLSQIPVLLLNAESDFYLQKDSIELMVALKQFHIDSDSISDNAKKIGRQQVIQHEVIKGTNHLTIMKNYGAGFLPNLTQDKHVDPKNDTDVKDAATMDDPGSMYSQVTNIISEVSGSVYNNILPKRFTNTIEKKDEVASSIFQFIKFNSSLKN